MKYYELKYSQTICRPRDEVFKFFSKPENLEIITPKRLGFKILTPRPILMDKGTIIDYYIFIFGFPVRWRTLITQYDPPNIFIDQQIKGPYSLWHHTHTFIENDGITIIHDKIRYIVPLGILGRLLNRLWIANDLKYIFEYRKNIINEHFDNRSNK